MFCTLATRDIVCWDFMDFKSIHLIPIGGKYFLICSHWKNEEKYGNGFLRPDTANAAWAAMAGLGSQG